MPENAVVIVASHTQGAMMSFQARILQTTSSSATQEALPTVAGAVHGVKWQCSQVLGLAVQIPLLPTFGQATSNPDSKDGQIGICSTHSCVAHSTAFQHKEKVLFL